MVDQAEGERNYYLLWRCFNAMKFNKHNERYTRAADELAVEIPMREDLERQIDSLKRLGNNQAKLHVLRRAFSRHADNMHTALMRWKDWIRYRDNVLHRVKNQLTHVH